MPHISGSWLAALLLIAASCVNAETATVRSGNGAIGGTDSAVHFLLGPATGAFSHTFTASDFSSAQNGPAAFILSANSTWVTGLSVDGSAKWIGTNSSAAVSSGSTALYAIGFQITNAFSAATLTLNYSVDDGIGDSSNSGVYVNGMAVCGSSFPSEFHQEHLVTCDISPHLGLGTNWLYIEDGNAIGAAGILFSATITTTGTGAVSLNPGAVVNVASYTPGAVAPGSLSGVFGNFPIGSPASASGAPWPTKLDGVSIQFNDGVQAPLVYASLGQVNIQIPWDLTGQTQTSLAVTLNGQTTAPQTVNLATFGPGIFSTNGQGTGQGAILDSSYRLVDPSNPSIPGSTIIQIFCTGLGPVANQPASGAAALSDPLSMTTATPIVTIGGISANVLFSGLAPGLVGGYQVNALVPSNAPTGNAVPVALSIGGVRSNTVTIAIQSPVVPNPQPSITALAPPMAQAGSGPLTLTIIGGGFLQSSTVSFNGKSHQPVFVSATQLTIMLSATDLSTAGNFAVIVSNPSPGGGGSNAVIFSVTTPAQGTLTGAWQGVWTSSVFLGVGGSLVANLTQTGTALTGTVSYTGSPCFSGGTISGQVSGSTLTASINLGGGQTASLSGTVNPSGRSISGSYTLQGGSCAPSGDRGSFSLTPTVSGQTGLTGNWQGQWASSVFFGTGGSLVANLSQSGTALTGTVSYNGSPCFSGGSISGQVNGTTLSATINVGGGQTVSLNGNANTGSTSISGSYTLQGGTCAPSGDRGTFSLNKSP